MPATGQKDSRKIDRTDSQMVVIESIKTAKNGKFRIKSLCYQSKNTTLTDEIAENVVGTAGDDTFAGVLGQTLNTGDVVDGKGGTDTLNLFGDDTATGQNDLSGNVTALPGGAEIKNVEVVNLISTAVDNSDVAQPALASVDASKFVGAEQIWQVGAASDVAKVGADQTVGFRGTDTSTTAVSATFTGEAANIAFDDVADGSRVDIEGAKIKTINLSGSVVDSNLTDSTPAQLDLGSEVAGSLAKLETINLAMTSDVQVNTYADAFANATTLNASESTGDLTMGFTDQAIEDAIKLETLTLGSGDDNLSIFAADLGAEAVSIDGGAGADTIQINLGNTGDDTALSLTGGDGDDVFAFDTGTGNITTANVTDEEFTNTVTIEDFGNGTDVLNLEGFTGFTAEAAVTAELNKLADDATLFDTVNAVANLLKNGGTNVTETAQFEFEGNTYVYSETDSPADGLDAGDVLIELVGTQTLDNNNVVDTFAS